MVRIIVFILPVFYIISGVLALKGIYIIKDAKDSAYFLIALGSTAIIYIIYLRYKKRNKNNPNKPNINKRYIFFKIVAILIMIIYFILRELEIYFTDDISFIIVLITMLIALNYEMKRIKKERESSLESEDNKVKN